MSGDKLTVGHLMAAIADLPHDMQVMVKVCSLTVAADSDVRIVDLIDGYGSTGLVVIRRVPIEDVPA